MEPGRWTSRRAPITSAGIPTVLCLVINMDRPCWVVTSPATNTGIGPLIILRRLREGDVVIVRTTAGRETPRVSSVRLIRKQALPLGTLFDREGQGRLQITTCGGPYIPSKGGYRDNLVVTAIPAVRALPDRSAPSSLPGRVQG